MGKSSCMTPPKPLQFEQFVIYETKLFDGEYVVSDKYDLTDKDKDE